MISSCYEASRRASIIDNMIMSRVARRSVCVCFGSKGVLLSASLSSDRHVFASFHPPQRRPFSSDDVQSGRSTFKAMPVDPKLLEYIERIGVGIPKRKARKRARTKKYSRKLDTAVLDTKEELDFFRQRIGNIKKERQSRKSKPSPSDSRPHRSSCLPPPPFTSTTSHQGVY